MVRSIVFVQQPDAQTEITRDLEAFYLPPTKAGVFVFCFSCWFVFDLCEPIKKEQVLGKNTKLGIRELGLKSKYGKQVVVYP